MKKWFVITALLAVLSGCSVQEAPSAPNDQGQVQVSVSKVKSSLTSAEVDNFEKNVEWAFTREKDHPEKLLVNTIEAAKSEIDVMIYSITQDNVIKAILDAKKRGVNVRIITDQEQAQNRSQAEDLRKLATAGISVKVKKSKGLMHIKSVVVDRKVVTTGSFNFTNAASTVNNEVLVVIHDEVMATSWANEFEDMYKDKDYVKLN
jgi:phosphatidylserine/phosphatidylglycerophosphate/cardiolipin synthase-like enzyme